MEENGDLLNLTQFPNLKPLLHLLHLLNLMPMPGMDMADIMVTEAMDGDILIDMATDIMEENGDLPNLNLKQMLIMDIMDTHTDMGDIVDIMGDKSSEDQVTQKICSKINSLCKVVF